MATGGIFQIITNDGKQDRMLMATALLHDRLDKIWRVKKALNPGLKDDDVRVLPSLIDIEKTHILFTNAHWLGAHMRLISVLESVQNHRLV